jgi:trehalose/maltose hydrolase-like predicted phosphorylase
VSLEPFPIGFDAPASPTAGSQSPSDWALTFDGYRPGDEGLREVLCAVGNGYLATRACAPGSRADGRHYPGTYVAGVFDRVTDHVQGVPAEHESNVNLPNWLSTRMRIAGGRWFDLDRADHVDYRQTMRLDAPELVREYAFEDESGRVTSVVERMFASMHDRHVCALQIELTPQNWSGNAAFCSQIDARVVNSGVRRYELLEGQHLGKPTFETAGHTLVTCAVATARACLPIAIGTTSSVWGAEDDRLVPANYLRLEEECSAGHLISFPVDRGRTVRFEKVAALYTGRDPGVGDPLEAAKRTLSARPRYADLFAAHRTAWQHIWERFALEVDGDCNDLRVLRLHVCHLLQTVSPLIADIDAGLPARGLHGEAYRGHVFWDELFVAPVLNTRWPKLVRSILGYRYRRLPEARRAALAAGYRGAMFPWQSGSDGREESPRVHLNPNSGRWNPDPSALAVHSGSAVAYDVWQHYQATADLEYLTDYGAEVLLEIARFWVSRSRFDERRDRYVIEGVIGPDEFHTGYDHRPFGGVDNNAYTNVMATWTIRRALEALEVLRPPDRRRLLETLSLDDEELTAWDHVASRMYVPFRDGIISQFDGYEDLRELDWTRYRTTYGDIGRMDRILEAEGDDVNRFQVTKQADVLMLFYLMSADELAELFEFMGYEFVGAQIPRTIDYYIQRTSHGSTLSSVVHTWVLARANRAEASSYFRDALSSDVADRQRGTTAEGIHLAAMAGSVDLLQRCYTGLELRSDRLVLGPMLPDTLGTLTFTMVYRGIELAICVRGRRATLTAGIEDVEPLTVECRGRQWKLAAGQTIDVG